MKFLKYKATFNDQDRTVFSFVKVVLKDVPLPKIEKLFRQKEIKINGKNVKSKRVKLQENDEVTIFNVFFRGKTNTSESKQNKSNNLNLEVIYEDTNILIVNKPYNVEVHGTANCLDKQVLTYLDFNQKTAFVPSHIGRLDKKTTGIMVYAKKYLAQRTLSQKGVINKKYEFKSDLPKSVETSFYIYHDEKNQKQKCSTFKKGKPSHTVFRVQNHQKIAYLKTGRKHQIRASLEKLGFPIYGDRKYGGKTASKMYLHAFEVTFKHLDPPFSYLNNRRFSQKNDWKEN